LSWVERNEKKGHLRNKLAFRSHIKEEKERPRKRKMPQGRIAPQPICLSGGVKKGNLGR